MTVVVNTLLELALETTWTTDVDVMEEN